MTFTIKDLWEKLGDIPTDEESGDIIEEQFLHFPIGALRYDIWHWFEDAFDVCVHDLMFPNDVPESIMREARIVIARYKQNWPEDEWIEISPEWDLNLTNNGEKGATLYRIKDGDTQTQEFWDVYCCMI